MRELPEYDVWYEVWGFDGFKWEFLADFDTRQAADEWNAFGEVAGTYEDSMVKKGRGLK